METSALRAGPLVAADDVNDDDFIVKFASTFVEGLDATEDLARCFGEGRPPAELDCSLAGTDSFVVLVSGTCEHRQTDGRERRVMRPTGWPQSKVKSLNPISQLRFDYDTTTTKNDMFIFLLESNRVEWKQARDTS